MADLVCPICQKPITPHDAIIYRHTKRLFHLACFNQAPADPPTPAPERPRQAA